VGCRQIYAANSIRIGSSSDENAGLPVEDIPPHTAVGCRVMVNARPSNLYVISPVFFKKQSWKACGKTSIQILSVYPQCVNYSPTESIRRLSLRSRLSHRRRASSPFGKPGMVVPPPPWSVWQQSLLAIYRWPAAEGCMPPTKAGGASRAFSRFPFPRLPPRWLLPSIHSCRRPFSGLPGLFASIRLPGTRQRVPNYSLCGGADGRRGAACHPRQRAAPVVKRCGA